MNIFRPFFAYDHGLPLGKPGFYLKSDTLHIIPNPLPSLVEYQKILSDPRTVLEKIGENDYYFKILYKKYYSDILPSQQLIKILFHEWYKYRQVFDSNGQIKKDTKALQITTALFDAFQKDSLEHSSVPLFLLIPFKKDVKKYYLNKVKSYQVIIDYLNFMSYNYLDLLEVLKIKDLSELESLFIDRHFSPKAHQIIADYIHCNLNSSVEPPAAGKSLCYTCYNSDEISILSILFLISFNLLVKLIKIFFDLQRLFIFVKTTELFFYPAIPSLL